MDQTRFDNFSRFLAARSTRRETVRRSSVGGIIGGVAAVSGVRSMVAQSGAVCVLPLTALVSVGPSIESNFEGTLTLEIGAEGAIDDGAFETSTARATTSLARRPAELSTCASSSAADGY